MFCSSLIHPDSTPTSHHLSACLLCLQKFPSRRRSPLNQVTTPVCRLFYCILSACNERRQDFAIFHAPSKFHNAVIPSLCQRLGTAIDSAAVSRAQLSRRLEAATTTVKFANSLPLFCLELVESYAILPAPLMTVVPLATSPGASTPVPAPRRQLEQNKNKGIPPTL